MTGVARKLVRSFGLIALFMAAALFGIASGVLFAFSGDLPAIEALDDYAPNTITRLLGRDGSVVGEFATERREVVTFEQIPPHLVQAILAAEDDGFFDHGGLEVPRMAMALGRDIVTRRNSPGASTITQQLARNLFPDSVGFERTWARKIEEALVAVQIEKRYTKKEIFTMYCNQIYWGHGAYGVQAASRVYFGKPVSDVTLDEAAMLAGIIQGNARQSPYVNMAAATRRRNYALERMAIEGMLSRDAADAAKKRPIVTGGEPTPAPGIAPHFAEVIRQHLDERYGAKAVYESGLTVRTGLDPGLQRASVRALDEELRRIDKIRGYRRPARNILADGKPADAKTLESFKHPRWSRDPAVGDIVPALIMDVQGPVIRVRVGRWHGAIDKKGYEWTRRAAEAVARKGDLIEARILGLDAAGLSFTAALEQVPEIEGAVVAIENRTGQILAMVGGQNFSRSQFNRATQAMRQVGSLFKPIVYTAAIDRGYTSATTLVDEPVSYPAGAGQPPYEPRNYDREFEGPISLRRALEQSRNIPAIRLMEALGPKQVISYARRLGITSPLPPYLPVAIGAAEATLLEMTSAYTAFANQGVRVTPASVLQVSDREGNVLEETRPMPHEALRADTAYVIAHLLQGVVLRGTAARAAQLGWPLGGKTGTTDDYTDAWFIGFDPDITVGVWIGLDLKKPLPGNQTGTSSALDVWIEIMKPWVERRRAAGAAPAFERPGNVILVMGPNGIEAYIAGTEPGIR